jgi:hypothetical protein
LEYDRAVARSGIIGVKAGWQRAVSPLPGGSGAVPPIFFLPFLPPKAAKNDLATALWRMTIAIVKQIRIGYNSIGL